MAWLAWTLRSFQLVVVFLLLFRGGIIIPVHFPQHLEGSTESLRPLPPTRSSPSVTRCPCRSYYPVARQHEFADAAMGIWLLLISPTRLADPFRNLIVCC